MNEKQRAIDTSKELLTEFDKTLKVLSDNYPRVSRVKKDTNLTEDVFKIVINTILTDILKQLQIDSNHLTINEFHAKYVPNLPILYRQDFTCEEFKEIIDSTYLKERDKKIAHKFFVEKKNVNDIFSELIEIDDKKTINNNLDNINDILLHRACSYNKHNK